MTYDSNYKMNPPLRRSDDVEALRAGVADGTISVLATDHAPHAKEEKELEFALAPFGIISLDCALGLYVKALIDSGHLDWPELLRRMTSNPAAVIGLDDLGTLTEGSPADLTVIDPETPYSVDVDSFASKARNCPYDGWELHARAVATVVDGRIKFQR
jgi:dihydroorotase